MQELIITDRGRELMAKLLQGSGTARFTEVQASEQLYRSTDIPALTALENVRATAPITEVYKASETAVGIRATIINNPQQSESGILQWAPTEETTDGGFYVNAVGVFAQSERGESFLYAVYLNPDNPDYLPRLSFSQNVSLDLDLVVTVSRADNIRIEIRPEVGVKQEQLDALKNEMAGRYASKGIVNQLNSREQNHYAELGNHRVEKVNSSSGAHGLRFYNDTLQILSGSNWVDVSGNVGTPPKDVQGLRAKAGNGTATIWWDDPADTVQNGKTVVRWRGTKLVYKAGAYPQSETDGTVAIDNTTRGRYKAEGFTVTGLRHGITYYFQLFPYSDKNIVNDNGSNRVEVVPTNYKIMSVVIDTANPNPYTCVQYADDARNMSQQEWADFFGYYPVILQNGREVKKLNPDDFSKYADGTSVPSSLISSSGDGDVMVAFPRRGIRFQWGIDVYGQTTGNLLTVSMTDDPNASGFNYYAHIANGGHNKNVFYLGSYLGTTFSPANKLRSIPASGFSAMDRTSGEDAIISAFKNSARRVGEGYDLMGFYQLTFLQVMSILRTKSIKIRQPADNWENLRTQNPATYPGKFASLGMEGEHLKSGNATELAGIVKCFGLEYLFGWVPTLLGDVSVTKPQYGSGVNFSFEKFSDVFRWDGSASGYLVQPAKSGYFGFLPEKFGGSSTTHFCTHMRTDFRNPYKNLYLSGSSLFSFENSYVSEKRHARLMYL